MWVGADCGTPNPPGPRWAAGFGQSGSFDRPPSQSSTYIYIYGLYSYLIFLALYGSFWSNMTNWTHLIRFRPVGGGDVCLGQLVDPGRDVGQDSLSGTPIFAFKISGTIFDGQVTEEKLQVERVSLKLSKALVASSDKLMLTYSCFVLSVLGNVRASGA